MDLTELWAIFGPGVAGAVFGAGWWFWVDAVVCSSVKVSFVHYLPGTLSRSLSLGVPSNSCIFVVLGFSILCVWLMGFVGIFASFAALMFNCVRKEDIDYSPYEEGEWRSGNLSLSCWVIYLYVCLFYIFWYFAARIAIDLLIQIRMFIWFWSLNWLLFDNVIKSSQLCLP